MIFYAPCSPHWTGNDNGQRPAYRRPVEAQDFIRPREERISCVWSRLYKPGSAPRYFPAGVPIQPWVSLTSPRGGVTTIPDLYMIPTRHDLWVQYFIDTLYQRPYILRVFESRSSHMGRSAFASPKGWRDFSPCSWAIRNPSPVVLWISWKPREHGLSSASGGGRRRPPSPKRPSEPSAAQPSPFRSFHTHFAGCSGGMYSRLLQSLKAAMACGFTARSDHYKYNIARWHIQPSN